VSIATDTAGLAIPAPGSSPQDDPGRNAIRTERLRLLCLIAVCLVALRVVDDAFLQPAAGVHRTDNLMSGLVPLVMLGAAAAVIARNAGATRTFVTFLVGLLGLVGGGELFLERGPVHGRVEPDDVSCLLSVAGGVALIGASLVFSWTVGRSPGRGAWVLLRRTATGIAAIVAAVVMVFPIGIGYFSTHAREPGVTTRPDLGVPVEKVSLQTSDGLHLTGWYAASHNGAAIIIVPGRSGLDHGKMLARHGYGVLLLNRRGEGDSQGDPDLFGWKTGHDIDGAVAYLRTRPDVRRGSIGALGLSVGGEVLIQHAAQTRSLDAIVAEGSGSRSIKESLELSGGIRIAELSTAPLLTAGVSVLSNQSPPPNLLDLARSVPPTPAFIIWGGRGQPAEIELSRRYAGAMRPYAVSWEVPDAGHASGLESAPEEYERRVVTFFDEALHPAEATEGELR
jgi:dienelactone hydrolase